jgi:hypothetical protein
MKFLPSFAVISVLLSFSACKKNIGIVIDQGTVFPKAGEFYKYTIRQGDHYADNNNYQAVEYGELKFVVKFDSTAIYQTIDPANQEDINKLYGFSDNASQHQQYSARIGWNWTRGALRLYAYTYNNGSRSSREITSIQPGNVASCSIKVLDGSYIFSVNGMVLEMTRESAGDKARGYRLYPYFGGDETAPHNINIWIKEL